jgi:hypothetical protein
MEIFVKATTLALTVFMTTSVQAFAHSGHLPEAGSLHAVQHSSGDWLVVAMALVVLGAGAMITARIRRRDR